MAPVTFETARSARAEAVRLRADTLGLKLVVRGNLASSRVRLGTAQAATARVRARRTAPLPSPWSELHWTRSYAMLERTLVPLP